jgi:hypothetical protein
MLGAARLAISFGNAIYFSGTQGINEAHVDFGTHKDPSET